MGAPHVAEEAADGAGSRRLAHRVERVGDGVAADRAGVQRRDHVRRRHRHQGDLATVARGGASHDRGEPLGAQHLLDDDVVDREPSGHGEGGAGERSELGHVPAEGEGGAVDVVRAEHGDVGTEVQTHLQRHREQQVDQVDAPGQQCLAHRGPGAQPHGLGHLDPGLGEEAAGVGDEQRGGVGDGEVGDPQRSLRGRPVPPRAARPAPGLPVAGPRDLAAGGEAEPGAGEAGQRERSSAAEDGASARTPCARRRARGAPRGHAPASTTAPRR